MKVICGDFSEVPSVTSRHNPDMTYIIPKATTDPLTSSSESVCFTEDNSCCMYSFSTLEILVCCAGVLLTNTIHTTTHTQLVIPNEPMQFSYDLYIHNFQFKSFY